MFLKMFADKELPGIDVKVPIFDLNGVRSSKCWRFEIYLQQRQTKIHLKVPLRSLILDLEN